MELTLSSSESRASCPASDEELVRLACTEGPVWFEELVYRHERRLLRFLEQRCGNRQDAEDLAQRTFINAYRALGRFDRRRPFAPWLFAIARRQAISHARRRKEEPLPPEEQWPQPAPSGADDRADAVWTVARRTLTEPQFSALWMAYAEELPLADVGRVLGITGLHARVLLHRARKALAKALERKRP